MKLQFDSSVGLNKKIWRKISWGCRTGDPGRVQWFSSAPSQPGTRNSYQSATLPWDHRLSAPADVAARPCLMMA